MLISHKNAGDLLAALVRQFVVGDDEAGESYACAKFSSGVLPPEALYELNGEERSQFDKYWADLKDTKTTSCGPR